MMDHGPRYSTQMGVCEPEGCLPNGIYLNVLYRQLNLVVLVGWFVGVFLGLSNLNYEIYVNILDNCMLTTLCNSSELTIFFLYQHKKCYCS